MSGASAKTVARIGLTLRVDRASQVASELPGGAEQPVIAGALDAGRRRKC